jgi:hypothetical protein
MRSACPESHRVLRATATATAPLPRVRPSASCRPYLPLRHSWYLTHGLALPRLHSLLSTHTAFESTTLVAAFGLDTFVVRVAPARAFDQLDPDFNFAVFAALLLGGGAVTLLMGRAADKRDLTQAWL